MPRLDFPFGLSRRLPQAGIFEQIVISFRLFGCSLDTLLYVRQVYILDLVLGEVLTHRK
jgi:hypothetical protein